MGNSCGWYGEKSNENELIYQLKSENYSKHTTNIEAAKSRITPHLANLDEGSEQERVANPENERVGVTEPNEEKQENDEVVQTENNVEESEKLIYMKEMENLFDEKIKNHGKVSDAWNMNSKTSSMIHEIENKHSEFLEIDQLEKNIANYNKEELFYKGIIQFDDGSYYNGTWNSNLKKHGYGFFLKSDGSKYGGTFVDDNVEGEGYFIHIKGNIYKGQFKNEQANGNGEILHHEIEGYHYKGEFCNNKMHGQGVENIPDETIYDGNFNMGEREAHGKMKFSDGSSYEGEFSKGEINGVGTYKWRDGKIYVGEFKNNKINGKGKTTWSDGNYYEGEYKNDQREGYGTHFVYEGERYFIGNWLNNLFHGQGKYKDNTVQYKGLWRLGKKIKTYN
jgi:hypothetical protein